MKAARITVHREDAEYGWAVCTCGNTVKFGRIPDECETICPGCGTGWGEDGEYAEEY